MRRTLLLLLLVVCAVSALFAQTRYTAHRLLRVFAESRARLAELHGYSQLDLVPGLVAAEPYLVAVPEDLEFLRLHGYRYEIVQENLEQYYASRLSTSLDLMGGYRTYSEINATLDSIHTAHPVITTAKFSLGLTGQGRDMWALKISDNPALDENEPEVFYTALLHAREPAAMEGLLYFMNYLTDNYGTNADVTELVNSRELYFLPCANPDGYVYNQTTYPGGGGLWRKNRNGNGVDLNRNFGLTWGLDDAGSSPIPTDETYRGPAAFSELETQHIRDFVNARQIVAQLDYHTFSNLVLFPWSTSYFDGDGLTADNATFQMLADSCVYFCHSVNGVWYTPGTPWQILYNTNGGSIDWEYGEQTTKPKIWAMSLEVGGVSDGFWPAANRILPLAQEILPTNLFIARIAGQLAPRPYAATVDGQCQGEWNGNDNGSIEPGEGFSLSVTLRNTGTMALSGLQGQLSTVDPNITLSAANSNWPGLNPGLTGTNTTVFLASVEPACPFPHTVLLALHVTSTNGLDTTLTLSANVGSTGIVDNVEGGAGGWFTSGGANPWHISTRRANSPTHSWFCGTESGSYANGLNCALTSGTVILSPGAELAYDQWYRFENGWDFGYVEINTGGGWTTLPGTEPVTGISGTWVHTILPLPVSCAGTALRVRFRMTSDDMEVDEGWYVDNIRMGCSLPPDVNLTTPSITASAMQGASDTETLHFCNTGLCPLTWSTSFWQVNGRTTAGTPHGSAGSLDNHGGPDAFGYRWRDSNDPGGPVFDWVEISNVGTHLSFLEDDDATRRVTLPWNFPFYGGAYNGLNVSTNGNVHFGTASFAWAESPIPTAASPNSLMALFWDDLVLSAGDGIYGYFDSAADRYIVQYNIVGGLIAEVILYHSGRIVFQYFQFPSWVISCTVGIENQTGTVGLQVVYDQTSVLTDLVAPLAIEFWVPQVWLSMTPTAGTLAPGACQDVALTCAAGTLDIGVYTGDLALHSNDPGETQLTIPVSFQVGALIPPASVTIRYIPQSQSLRLGWTANGAATYKVYAAATADGPFTTLVGTTTTNSLIVPLPAEEIRFYIVVAAS